MTENSKLIADLLARRRQQISRLAEHQGVIETIRADIAAIEAKIQICAPDLGERLRKQQTPSHHIEFNKGEALQLSLIALKKIGRPAEIHEIANIVATLKNADASAVPAIVKSLYYYLSKGAAEGYLKQARSGAAAPLWEPAPITMRRARKLSFKTGEGMQLTLDALREIGRPALASEIAVVVARRKGFGEMHHHLLKWTLPGILRYCVPKGLIESAGHTAHGEIWWLGPVSAIPQRKLHLKPREGLPLVLDALRTIGGPAHINEIADTIAVNKTINKDELTALIKSLYGVLSRAVTLGAIEKANPHAGGVRWQLPSPEILDQNDDLEARDTIIAEPLFHATH